ncbi:MAG: hypothetical protein ACK5PB_04930 [Pirellula sp.]|jgi:hypothetical protein
MATPSTHVHSTERLFELIETKLHLLEEMQALTIEQADQVVQHDMTALMVVLSRKQSLMESLQSVQTELLSYRDEDPDSRVWSSPDKRTRCKAMVQRSEQLLSELIVQENRCLDNMNLKRDSVLTQLQQNVAASQLQAAYSSVDSAAETEDGFSLEG